MLIFAIITLKPCEHFLSQKFLMNLSNLKSIIFIIIYIYKFIISKEIKRIKMIFVSDFSVSTGMKSL